MTDSIVAPHPLTKHPDESVVYSMDFVNLLDVEETITSVANGTPTVDAVSSPPVTFGVPSIVGSAVTFRISGGSDGTDYRVTVEVGTSEGNIRAAIGILYVRE